MWFPPEVGRSGYSIRTCGLSVLRDGNRKTTRPVGWDFPCYGASYLGADLPQLRKLLHAFWRGDVLRAAIAVRSLTPQLAQCTGDVICDFMTLRLRAIEVPMLEAKRLRSTSNQVFSVGRPIILIRIVFR